MRTPNSMMRRIYMKTSCFAGFESTGQGCRIVSVSGHCDRIRVLDIGPSGHDRPRPPTSSIRHLFAHFKCVFYTLEHKKHVCTRFRLVREAGLHQLCFRAVTHAYPSTGTHCCNSLALSLSQIEHNQNVKLLLCLKVTMSGRQATLASFCCQASQQQQMRAQPDVPENPISTNDVIEYIRAATLHRKMMLAGACNMLLYSYSYRNMAAH
jgi:hypothetical protein